MEVSEEQIEQTNILELDIPKTFFSNIFMIYGGLITLIYIQMFMNMINSFTLPEMRIIALLMFAYSMIKIMIALTNSINFEYKPRVNKDEIAEIPAPSETD